MNPILLPASTPAYRLTSDLYRECLPTSDREPHRRIAWMNPICLSVLLVGVALTREPALLPYNPDIHEPPQRMVVFESKEPDRTVKTVDLKQAEVDDDRALPVFRPEPVRPIAASEGLFGIPTPIDATGVPQLRPTLPGLDLPAPLPKPPVNLRPSERASYGNLPWPTGRDYPKEAAANRETGDVILIVEVGPDGGSPTSVRIEQPSSSALLNTHAREWIQSRWKFKPLGEPYRFRTCFTYQLGI